MPVHKICDQSEATFCFTSSINVHVQYHSQRYLQILYPQFWLFTTRESAIRWTNHFQLRKFNYWTLIKLEEGGRRVIMIRLWGSSSQASLVFWNGFYARKISKCGQEDLDYDDDISEKLQVFTKIYKAHLFILRLEICKEAKKSNWMKIMMSKKSNCRFLPNLQSPSFHRQHKGPNQIIFKGPRSRCKIFTYPSFFEDHLHF